MDDFDQTQAIALEDFGEDDDATDDLEPDEDKKPAAYIKVQFQKGLTETSHPLYEGDNIIGRSADTCHVCIPSKSLSKEHACIQIVADSHMIFDKGSRNKTRRGKLFLSPEVRYELKHDDEITFADVKCIYQFAKQIDTVAETGSETDGSESLLLKHDVTDEDAFNRSGKEGNINNHNTTHTDDKGNASAFVVKDTPEAMKSTPVHSSKAPPQTLVFSESESEDDDEKVVKDKKKTMVQETLLCEDSDPEASHDHEAFTAATQAYVAGNHDDDADTDEETARADLIGAATQAYVGVHNDDDDEDDDEDEKKALACEPTQAFIQPRKSPVIKSGILKSSHKTSSQLAGTQSFEVGSKEGEEGTQAFDEVENKTNIHNDSGDSATRPTQVFDEEDDDDDTENNEAAGLFAVSTMACDFGDNGDDEDEDAEEEAANRDIAGADDPTQLFDLDAPTQKIVPKKDENANSDTVDINSDATVAISEIDTHRNQRKNTKKISEEAPTIAVDDTLPAEAVVNTSRNVKSEADSTSDMATQVFDETLPVTDKASPGKNEPTKARRGRSKKGVEEETDTMAVDSTLPVSEISKSRRGRSGGPQQTAAAPTVNITDTVVFTEDDKAADSDEPTQAVSDEPTQKFDAVDSTLPVSEIRRKTAPAKRGRGRGRHQTSAPTLSVADTVAISEDSGDGGGDEPTQVYGDITNEPTQAYTAHTEDGDSNTASNKMTKHKKQLRQDLSDEEEEDDEKPWAHQAKSEEPTQDYGAAADDDNEEGATQPYGVDDDKDESDDDGGKAGVEEPTQAYGLGIRDEDATQAYEEDNDDADDEAATQAFGVEDPTQKYNMVVEDDEEDSKAGPKSAQKVSVKDPTPDMGSDDDSDLEEESVLRTDSGLSSDPTQLIESHDVGDTNKSKPTEPEPTLAYDMAVEEKPSKPRRGRQSKAGRDASCASNDNSAQPTLAYDMAVEEEPSKPQRGRPSRARGQSKVTVSDSTTSSSKEISPEIPSVNEKVKEETVESGSSVSATGIAVKTGSLSDTEEMVPDSMVDNDEDVRPAVIQLPSRSPLKPVLVDRSRSPSPAPKHVAFAEPSKEEKETEEVETGRRGRTRTSPAKISQEAGSLSPKAKKLEAKQPHLQASDKSKRGKAKAVVEPAEEDIPGEETKKEDEEIEAGGEKQKAEVTDKKTAAGSSRRVSTRKAAASSGENATDTSKTDEGESQDDSMRTGVKEKRGQVSASESKKAEVDETSQPSTRRGKHSAAAKGINNTAEQVTTKVAEDSQPSIRKGRKSAVIHEETAGNVDATENENSQTITRKGRRSVAAKALEDTVVSAAGAEISGSQTRGKRGASVQQTVTPSPGPSPKKKPKKADQPKNAEKKDADGNETDETASIASSMNDTDSKVDVEMKDREKETGAKRGKRVTREKMKQEEVKSSAAEESSGRRVSSRGRQISANPYMKDFETGTKAGKHGRSSSATSDKDTTAPKSQTEVKTPTNSTTHAARGKRGKAKLSEVAKVEDEDQDFEDSELPPPASTGKSKKILTKESKFAGGDTKELKGGKASNSRPIAEDNAENNKNGTAVSAEKTTRATRKRGRKSSVSSEMSEQNEEVEKNDSQVSDRLGNDSEVDGSSQPATKGRGRKGRAPAVPASTPQKKARLTTSATPASQRKSASSSSPATPASQRKSALPSSPATPAEKAVIHSETTHSPALRKSTMDHKPKVMFTGVIDEQGEKIVKDLGGELASSIQDCTHLVTDKIRRTVKFLSGLAKGLFIVSPQWLESCKQAGTFLDGHKFLVSDPAMEKQYKFILSTSVAKALNNPLLTGYKVHVSKSVKPDPIQMQDILRCAGAEYLKTMPSKSQENTVVISCPEDQKLCQPALKAGIPVVGAEFILTGILRQDIDFQSFSLFGEENSSQTTGKGKRKK